MRTLEEFKRHFSEHVYDELQELEESRKDMHNKRIEVGGLSILAVFLTWIMVHMGLLHSYTIAFMVLTAPSVGFWLYMKHYYNPDISDTYKKVVVEEMLHFMDPSLQYTHTQFVPYDTWKASFLFPMIPDKYEGDDLIVGTIDGIPLQLSEIIVQNNLKVIERKERNILERFLATFERKEQWETLFHGIFLAAEYPKSIKGRMFILPDTLQKTLGHAGRIIQENNLIRGKYIHPQNYEFKQNYVVYADHELEGEELLTEELMEKMLTLKKRSNTPVYCSIVSNKIYVAVDLRKELFQVNTARPLYNHRFVENFYNELLYIFSIIEDLNIDELELPTRNESDVLLEDYMDAEDDAVIEEEVSEGRYDNHFPQFDED
ncbi:DUF3137 domain-containing protein [Algivirga pacifica]|uniref:DUF3137 domain-containing protein n=1 Tax=Algivirga pacifica TaxID=1162670 RepID=A0ABP9D9S0_9BACT